ncbi:hypothetical protein U0070_023759 [Myodes glareolus]|uniref:Uncharacterized protein n=1 Tax=Myodes glareolus TaxID=447135 RepID=A0AAW0HVD3_MYOGA
MGAEQRTSNKQKQDQCELAGERREEGKIYHSKDENQEQQGGFSQSCEETSAKEDSPDIDCNGPFSGQLIAIVEASMPDGNYVHIMTTSDVLSQVYAVLSKQEGRVLQEQVKEERDMFIKVMMPVDHKFTSNTKSISSKMLKKPAMQKERLWIRVLGRGPLESIGQLSPSQDVSFLAEEAVGRRGALTDGTELLALYRKSNSGPRAERPIEVFEADIHENASLLKDTLGVDDERIEEGFEILELGSLALHLQANVDSFIDEINDPTEVILAELPRSQCWGAEPQAPRSNGTAVSRAGVLVGSDGHQLQHPLSSGPIQALRSQVHQHQVGVSATRHQGVASLEQGISHGLSVPQHL